MTVMSDLKERVMQALADNPRVHADEIAVEVAEGDVVHLHGTVGSPLQEAEAFDTARDVLGVNDVYNDLDVQPMGVDDTLIQSSDVPMQDVGVDADADTVTLRGEVATGAQRERAEALAYEVPGVKRVWNRLKVRS
jgi:osmotically-inducible protein OsmY